MDELNDWLREERHTRWTLALYREFESLNREHRLSLTTPLIGLHAGASQWGRWSPAQRTLSLASALIEGLPWRVVVQILKHEMAHQLVSERLLAGRPEEPPHGPAFQRACEILRVEPWARGAHARLDRDELQRAADWRLQPSDARGEKYLRRLEKLLALAGSANEHEALLAMRRARELQTQYRLEGLQDRATSGFVSLELGRGRRRQLPYEGRIGAILVAHFHVRAVFISRYNAAMLGQECLLDVMGRREDVQMAEYVYAFLHRSVAELWQSHRKSSGARGIRQRNSYIRGVLAGFDEKLSREQADDVPAVDPAPIRALVAREQGALRDYVRSRYPRLTTRRSGARIDTRTFHQGQAEGRKLHLRRPLDESHPASGQALLAPAPSRRLASKP
jgi:hypothetical protein